MPLRFSLSSAPMPPQSTGPARRWWRPDARRSAGAVSATASSTAPLRPIGSPTDATDRAAQDEHRYLQRLREAGL